MANKFISDWDKKLIGSILNNNPILKEKIEKNDWKQFWEIITVNWNMAIKIGFLNILAEADIDCGLETIDEKFISGDRGSIQVLSVPKCVTKIDEYTFFGCDNLSRIKIPNSVETIGRRAFGGYNNILVLRREVIIPERFKPDIQEIGFNEADKITYI